MAIQFFFWLWAIHAILKFKRNIVFIITLWLAIMVESVRKIVAKFACGNAINYYWRLYLT